MMVSIEQSGGEHFREPRPLWEDLLLLALPRFPSGARLNYRGFFIHRSKC